MRENKQLNSNLPSSGQNVCWVELHDIPNSDRENKVKNNNRGIDNLPSLTCGQSRSTHHNMNNQFSLPSLPHKQNSAYHMPVQQSEEPPLLTPRMPHIVHEQKPRNTIKYVPHPPLKEKHHGDQITDASATKMDARRTNAFLRARHPGHGEIRSDAFIDADEDEFSYDRSPRVCFEEVKYAEHTTTTRPVTNIRSVMKCTDAPVLHGKRGMMVPHPPSKPRPHLEPCNSLIPHPPLMSRAPLQPIGIRDQEDKNLQSTKEDTELSLIEKKRNSIKKNIIICEPPKTPKLNQACRRKWRNATLKR